MTDRESGLPDLREALQQAQARIAQLRERREAVWIEKQTLDGELKEAAQEEAALTRIVARLKEATP